MRYLARQKSPFTKPRKEVTRKWKKNNPNKVKSYAAKYNGPYYQKTKEKRSLEYKITYHKIAIGRSIPCEYYEFVDDITLQPITIDHDYYDTKFARPTKLWKNVRGNRTIQEIQTNIDYVLRLQKKNILPVFLINHAETYFLYNKLSELKYEQLQRLLGVKKEEWGKHFKEHDKERYKLFIKLLDENYEKHISKS